MTVTPSRFRRALAPVAGLATAALVLAGCTGGSVPETTGSTANVDTTPVIGDAECERNRDVGTITYISGYGFSASAGQMDVFVAKERGYFDQLCLDVEINAAGANGQQLVSSGQAQFTALGSASDVLLTAENTDNLTAIATYGTTSPFSIFAHPDITSLSDLEGGTLGYFLNVTPMALAMLDAAGVDTDNVAFVKMTNYDPTVVTRGQVDAIVGYASNQPERLRALGEDFSEFLPADYDLSGSYNVMEVNSQFLAEHREVVSDFMRASLRALHECLEDEAACVDLVSSLAQQHQQGEAFPLDQQTRTWAVESQWVRDSAGGPPGVMSIDSWQAEATLVAKYGSAVGASGNVPDTNAIMDHALVADLYDGDRLLWPEPAGR